MNDIFFEAWDVARLNANTVGDLSVTLVATSLCLPTITEAPSDLNPLTLLISRLSSLKHFSLAF